MRVLFAVNNDNISNAIVKKYQKNYKEILSYKNVYYFNAILKELQKDKTYDRLVISEDLEPFANNNYDTIDKFLFEKLDKISDETERVDGNNTEIILICTDRRNKSDEMLVKIFSIGIYNAIIDKDRSIEEVCRLINKPRAKKEAKIYYKIESDNASYQSEDVNNVSESEVQNILAHYKKLGKNEEKYVESFNNIVSQYTDNQLKIIIKYLPINVKAVLEEKSTKYQELVTFSGKSINTQQNIQNQIEKKEISNTTAEILNKKFSKPAMSNPVVIPSGLNKNQVKKLIEEEPEQENDEIINGNDEYEENVNEDFNFNENSNLKKGFDFDEKLEEIDDEENEIEENNEENYNEIEKTEKGAEEIQEKRGRGRPKKDKPLETDNIPKRGRGRPKKYETNIIVEEQEQEQNNQEDDDLIDLFNIDKEQDQEDKTQENEELNNEQEENNNDENPINLFGLDSNEEISGEQENTSDIETENNNLLYETNNNSKEPIMPQIQNENADSNLSSLVTKEKKVVCFVGTTKNGTSFVVNNLGEMLSSMGINTAVLDMTKSKNAYYIYTNNEEELRKITENSISNLKNGIAEGIRVNRNLTIYTEIPGEEKDYTNAETILSTLVKNYNVVLVDCDFDTPIEYFSESQEIYLVQSMDVLTIQPLTAFLRNLKTKNILKQDKVKIVINKEQKIRSLNIKTLIGGLAFYNDPSMSFMTELFNKDTVKYCVIPFEIQNYVKYLDSLVNCKITLNGYTKNLINSLKELANMVYPLVSQPTYSPRGDRYKEKFSNEMNDTLNKMKQNIN